MNQSTRLLLLVQSHAHVAALMDCIPHIRAHYEWLWVVYSPAVLADPALVEREFDQQIADLTEAARACYAREDGAGGDAYKMKRDAAILEKSAKVKDAWKALPEDQKTAAFERLFRPFYQALKTAAPNISIAIHQAADHYETAAHVEFQNSLKAGMKEGFKPGDYVVGWPTSLPKGGKMIAGLDLGLGKDATATIAVAQETFPHNAGETVRPVPTAPPIPAIKIDKRTKEYKTRLKELQTMSLDDLGPIAFELGIKPGDPIAGKRDTLIERILELELAADVNAY